MRGGDRRSKPAALRAIDGSKKRARHVETVEVEMPAATFAAPADLSAAELEVWAYYFPKLEAAGILKDGDRDALANYCTAIAAVADIRRQMAAPGWSRVKLTTYRDDTGETYVKRETDPLDAQLRAWLPIARQLGEQLALSPAARARVRLPAGAAAKGGTGGGSAIDRLRAIRPA